MSFVATHRPPALSDALPRPTASEMNQETSEKGAGGIKSRRPTDEIKEEEEEAFPVQINLAALHNQRWQRCQTQSTGTCRPTFSNREIILPDGICDSRNYTVLY